EPRNRTGSRYRGAAADCLNNRRLQILSPLVTMCRIAWRLPAGGRHMGRHAGRLLAHPADAAANGARGHGEYRVSARAGIAGGHGNLPRAVAGNRYRVDILRFEPAGTEIHRLP